ncbi:Uncharacterised protein [Mycobacteroides abscessus subsp. abscessus]|nr:Uncharacterised protein [Mycobacteroides abscessus subsp. abscessus]
MPEHFFKLFRFFFTEFHCFIFVDFVHQLFHRVNLQGQLARLPPNSLRIIHDNQAEYKRQSKINCRQPAFQGDKCSQGGHAC